MGLPLQNCGIVECSCVSPKMSQNSGVITRSGSTSSLIGSLAKRSREDLTKHDGDNEIVSLDDLWNKMQTMLTSTCDRIEKKIESCNATLEKRMSGIEGELNAVRKECSEKVVKLEETVAGVRADLDFAVEAMYRMDKSRELILSGIPFQSRENLDELFRKIALTIGYSENQLPLVGLHRLARAPISSGTSPLILCEFALHSKRNEFYRLYLSKRSLCLRDIGFDSGNRVYVNENLTNNARKIRAEAVKLKKLGHLDQVSTRNGIVHVRRKGSDNASAIYSLDQIALHNKNPIQ